MSVAVKAKRDVTRHLRLVSTPLPKDYRYIECRDTGHKWRTFSSEHRVQVKGRIVPWRRRLRCPDCTTTRTDFLRGDGSKESQSQYKHPPDYKVPGARLEAMREARLRMVRLADKAPGWLNIKERKVTTG